MSASETRDGRGRVRGNVLVAAVSLLIGVAGSAWARTQMTAGVWAVLLIAGLAVVLMLLGPKVVKR